ncbi:MAG TPA: bifunctional shikimate kinase/3-dehydroquinate synthase [Solirubrobacteraceae bacterium]|jgi:shikimate kinase/3-dehydroquinate synthase
MASLTDVPSRALVFVGFMGAGKSTVAAEVAATLGVQALDTDRLLEESLGHSIAREFELRGEASFRAAEEDLACQLLVDAGRAPRQTVIALGGGGVLSPRVREALAPHLVVLLDIDAQSAWRRVGAGSGRERRPLAEDREAFLALHASRSKLYESLADAILPATGPRVGARALPALGALAAAPHGTRLLWASAASGDYPVLVGRGLLQAQVCEMVWPLERRASRPFCVSDTSVAPLYAERLGGVARLVEMAPGERNKTLSSAEAVWSALVAGGMTRADHVVALGGGVVGDLAGFCAASYQRGVPVVHVPTTVVAQVDSAYGGKTGVDLPAAKNYVGAYHHPAGVLVDPDTLETLPSRELAAGYVEVLKTALVAGGELWERVAADEPLDERTILACARTKLAVVAEDERDAGRRQVLNLGHTVGHALETVTGYERYRHGEAVGLGLLAALRLSGADELRARVRALLTARGLPVRLDGEDVEEILAATMRDKKRVGAQVPFVLLETPGEPRIGCHVPAGELRAAVSELQGPS